MTASETVVTVLIWLLTACGGFFSLRAALRRKRRGENPAGKNRRRS